MTEALPSPVYMLVPALEPGEKGRVQDGFSSSWYELASPDSACGQWMVMVTLESSLTPAETLNIPLRSPYNSSTEVPCEMAQRRGMADPLLSLLPCNVSS